MVVSLILEAERDHKVVLEHVINRIKDAREWHISNQGYFQPSEQSSRAFLRDDLAESICNTIIFLESNDFKSCLYNDQRVRNYRLERS